MGWRLFGQKTNTSVKDGKLVQPSNRRRNGCYHQFGCQIEAFTVELWDPFCDRTRFVRSIWRPSSVKGWSRDPHLCRESQLYRLLSRATLQKHPVNSRRAQQLRLETATFCSVWVSCLAGSPSVHEPVNTFTHTSICSADDIPPPPPLYKVLLPRVHVYRHRLPSSLPNITIRNPPFPDLHVATGIQSANTSGLSFFISIYMQWL